MFAIAVVGLVDLFPRFQGFCLLVLLVVEHAQIVEGFLLGVVHGVEFANGFLQLPDGQVHHVLVVVALGKDEHGLGADVRIALGLLQLWNGFRRMSGGIQMGSQFETQLHVRGVLVHAISSNSHEAFFALFRKAIQFFLLGNEIRMVRVFARSNHEAVRCKFRSVCPEVCLPWFPGMSHHC